MKRIDNYTIYCTPEQTKNALELGAKIIWCEKERKTNCPTLYEKDKCYKYFIPTAEQMIGWLEEQELIEGITIGYAEGIEWFFDVNNLSEPFISVLNFNSRKEATLAAIDAALNYLSSNKSDYEEFT